MKYIISYNEQERDLCFNELKNLEKNFNVIKNLNDFQSIINIDLNNVEFVEYANNLPIIFLRHIFFVNREFDIKTSEEKIIDYVFENIDVNKTASIQFQSNKNLDNQKFNARKLAVCLVEKYSNILIDVKNPSQIISVYEDEEFVYVGIGNENLNLSNYKGGMPHFSKNYNFVSRAEFKLLEIIDILNLDLSKFEKAIDLGSAPGGWTKVLADKIPEVHSVDPANLDKKVKERKNVKHFNMTTQKYLEKFDYGNFDIITNDMKMDPKESSQIILDFYDRLKQRGYVIMTFKLAKNFNYKSIITNIEKLEQKYSLVLARQLFHNRSEITVVLQK